MRRHSSSLIEGIVGFLWLDRAIIGNHGMESLTYSFWRDRANSLWVIWASNQRHFTPPRSLIIFETCRVLAQAGESHYYPRNSQTLVGGGSQIWRRDIQMWEKITIDWKDFYNRPHSLTCGVFTSNKLGGLSYSSFKFKILNNFKIVAKEYFDLSA